VIGSRFRVQRFRVKDKEAIKDLKFYLKRVNENHHFFHPKCCPGTRMEP
jgi:hypothetical protein